MRGSLRMNSGKPCSVRLTEGLGRARTERHQLLSWLETARLVAADVIWLLDETNPLHCTCIRLPILNLLEGTAKRPKLLFWRRCEPCAIRAAARVDATATVVLLFATTRRLPRTGTDQQPSDYPTRGAIN